MDESGDIELIGLWFISDDYQGRVESRPEPGFYLVAAISWLTGGFDSFRVVPLSEMLGWSFYDDKDDFLTAGKEAIRGSVVAAKERRARQADDVG